MIFWWTQDTQQRVRKFHFSFFLIIAFIKAWLLPLLNIAIEVIEKQIKKREEVPYLWHLLVQMLLSCSAIIHHSYMFFNVNMVRFNSCRREDTTKLEGQTNLPLPETKPGAWRKRISSNYLPWSSQVFMILYHRCVYFCTNIVAHVVTEYRLLPL